MDRVPYSLRHPSIVRGLSAGLPVRLVAAMHDTSAVMVENHYSAFIVGAPAELVRRAMVPLAPAPLATLRQGVGGQQNQAQSELAGRPNIRACILPSQGWRAIETRYDTVHNFCAGIAFVVAVTQNGTFQPMRRALENPEVIKILQDSIFTNTIYVGFLKLLPCELPSK